MSLEALRALRAQTEASLSDCRAALAATADPEAAVAWLDARGLAPALTAARERQARASTFAPTTPSADAFWALWAEDRRLDDAVPDADRLQRYRHAADLIGEERANLERELGLALIPRPRLAVSVGRTIGSETLDHWIAEALKQQHDLGLRAALLQAGERGQVLDDVRRQMQGPREAFTLLDTIGALGPDRWSLARPGTALRTPRGPAIRGETELLGKLRLDEGLVICDPAALRSARPLALRAPGTWRVERVLAELEGQRRVAAVHLLANPPWGHGLDYRAARDQIATWEPALDADGSPAKLRTDTATGAITTPKVAAASPPELDLTTGSRRRSTGIILGFSTGLGDGAYPVYLARDASGAPIALSVDLLGAWFPRTSPKRCDLGPTP